ncbi:hypothetical protein ACFW2V_13815 [Streptomyces sp. NPDC058947]|uniref:hypothetical protein n=1 Tax=Streptomyces sp. NPDC058947 TaxID=3346675 RepID=UPI0036A79FD8
MDMHEAEEYRLARDLKEEFDRQAIHSGADVDFLDLVETLAGEPKPDSRLAKDERLHLIAIYYRVRWCAERGHVVELATEMEDARNLLAKRGLNEKAAALMVQCVAEERTISLISLADQTASMLEWRG